ncbi:unnamed protein product [Caenorhabditis nigoni]
MLRMIPILILILLVHGDGNVAFEEDLFSNFTFINSTNSTTTIPPADFTDTLISALIFTIFLVLLVFFILATIQMFVIQRTPDDEVEVVEMAAPPRRRRQNREENIPLND